VQSRFDEGRGDDRGEGGFEGEGILTEKELTLKRIQFLKKNYSRGFFVANFR